MAGVKRVLEVLGTVYRIPQHRTVKRMEVWRVDKRNRCLNLSSCVGDRASQPCLGVVLGTRMTTAFSLDDDGPTARFLYEDVGTAAAFENLARLLASVSSNFGAAGPAPRPRRRSACVRVWCSS